MLTAEPAGESADAVSALQQEPDVFGSAAKPRTTVAFVVNGDEASAMAHRARAFASHLNAEWRIEVLYRSRGRFGSIPAMTRALLGQRPRVSWVFDMALAGVTAAAAARTTGVRMVIDTGDAIAALARQGGLRGPAGVAATAGLERLAPRVADAIVVRGSEHQRLLLERGVQSVLIPDGVDLAPFDAAMSTVEARRRLQLSNELVVAIVGSMVWSPTLGMTYGWDLVEALALTRGLPIVGLLVGDGSGVAHLQARAAALGVGDRIRFLGRQPFEALPDLLAACDVCLSTQTNDLVGRVRTTGKLPLYMASGRYILASRVGEAVRVLPAEMLIEYNGTIDPDYPGRLADRLSQLCANRNQLSRGRALVDVARREFSYDTLVPRVDGVLRAVVRGAAA